MAGNAASKKKTVRRSPPAPKELFITYRIGEDENGNPDIDKDSLELHRDSADVLRLVESGARKYKSVTLHPPVRKRRASSEGDEGSDD